MCLRGYLRKMKFRVIGWNSKHLRHCNASCEFNAGNKVDFVQMNNGVGKTTTLLLLRIALTGEKDLTLIDEKSKEEVEKGNKTKLELLHDLIEKDSDKGQFVVKTLINNESYVFEVNISRNNDIDNSVSFRTESNELKGVRDGWHPPFQAYQFLNKDFVQFIFFDGERQKSIFNKGQAYARQTIYTLCQFNILEEAIIHAKNYVEQESESTGKGDKAQLKSFITQKNNAVKALDKIIEARDKLESKIADNQKKFDELDNAVKDVLFENEQNKEKYKEFQNKLTDSKTNIKNKLQSIFRGTIINPNKTSVFTNNKLNNFKERLDKYGLPGRASREFFVEISKRDKCICDREIGPVEKETIIGNMDEFLREDETAILNAMKTQISSYPKGAQENISSEINSLGALDREHTILKRQFAKFEADNTKDESHASNIEERAKLKVNIENDKNLLNEYDAPLNGNEVESNNTKDLKNIKSLKAIVDKREKRIYEYSQVVDLKERSDFFKKIILESITEASKNIFAGMTVKIQEKLDDIMPNSSIVIEEIGDYVKLNRTGLSSGQALTTSYTFIAAALEFSNLSLPFIADTPTGTLDAFNRSGVGKLIPKVAPQFIPFLQPTENSAFVSHCKKSAKNKCSYTTIMELDSKHKEYLASIEISNRSDDLRYFDNDRFAVLYGEKYWEHYTNWQVSSAEATSE